MIKKKDKINLLIITTIIMIIVAFILFKNNIVLNYELPEYFRNLFSKTKEFFPNYLFELNNGTSALKLTSYGIYNPIILLSYFLPFLSMKLYLTIINIICSISSIFLFYYFLRKNKFDEKISLIGCLSLLVMMPILNSITILLIIISFIKVDKYFEKNKSVDLIISIALMLLLNIGNVIIAILCLLIYFIYKLFINKEKNKVVSLLTILLPVITLIFLVIPSSNLNIKFSLSTSMYKLFALIIISLIVLFEDQKIENKFLSIILVILLLFDFNGVELLIPIYSYIIVLSLEKIFKEIDIKKLIAYLVFITIFFIINSGVKSFIYYIDIVILLVIIDILLKRKNKNLYIMLVVYLLLYSFTNFEYNNYLKDDFIHEELKTFTSSNTFNEKEYKTFVYPYTEEIKLEYIITSDSKNIQHENHIMPYYIKVSDITYMSPSIIKNSYKFTVSKNNSKMNISIPKIMRNKIIYIEFDLDGNPISINGIKNKYNKYEIYQEGLTNVDVIFDKGNYTISNFRIYYLDPKYLDDFDLENININEKINVKKDSYLATNIKYDDNIEVSLDSKKIVIEKVNQSYIGFKIPSGNHSIKLHYKNNFIYYFIISCLSSFGYIYLIFRKRN